jgi:hypothetical protein
MGVVIGETSEIGENVTIYQRYPGRYKFYEGKEASDYRE